MLSDTETSRSRCIAWLLTVCLGGLLHGSLARAADADDFDNFENTIDALQFDDQPLEEPLGFPDFFKLSFLDLQEDLQEAKAAGKAGIMVKVEKPSALNFLEDIVNEEIRRNIAADRLIRSRISSARASVSRSTWSVG